MYALHSLYSPPGRLQRSGLIVKYGLTSIHTIHTFLPCASSHPSLIRASPHPPIYLGCACPFQQRAFCPPDRIKPHSLGHPQPFVSATCHFFIEFEGIHPQFDHSHFYTVRLLPAILLLICLYPSDTRSF